MPYVPPVDYVPQIEEIYRYIPPNNSEQSAKQTALNDAARSFAFVIDSNISNAEYKKQILFLLQQTSLLGQQAITIDYLKAPVLTPVP